MNTLLSFSSLNYHKLIHSFLLSSLFSTHANIPFQPPVSYQSNIRTTNMAKRTLPAQTDSNWLIQMVFLKFSTQQVEHLNIVVHDVLGHERECTVLDLINVTTESCSEIYSHAIMAFFQVYFPLFSSKEIDLP